MKNYYSFGNITPEEKASILEKHRHLYNGYRTMQPEVAKEQPLYVYDPAQDKLGASMNNKGEVKPYTDYRINESEEKSMCSECGGMMREGECSECGWKGDMGEGKLEDIKDKVKNWLDDEGESKLEKAIRKIGDYLVDLEDKIDGVKEKETKEGYKTGKLDDIYDQEDLNASNHFDYVEGGGNKYGVFHVKKESEMEEQDDLDDGRAQDALAMQADTGQQTFHGEKDMACDGTDDDSCDDRKMMGDSEMKEQGGNADDMDVSDVEPAYDFVSGGPDGGESFPETGDDLTVDEEKEFETMESAWSVNAEEPWSVYSDMEPAYDFDSEGPTKAGPFMSREEESKEEMDIEDLEDAEAAMWEEIDEDLKESFLNQKNKITEMFNRFKTIK